jgi:hypothetical protein
MAFALALPLERVQKDDHASTGLDKVRARLCQEMSETPVREFNV